MTGKSNCDYCVNYYFDEDYESYNCMMNLDEDELGKFMQDTFSDCPYYQTDEYAVVKKQN